MAHPLHALFGGILLGGATLCLAGPDGPGPLEGPYLGMTPPGDQPVRFAPDVITTPPGVHSAAVFAPDGRTLLWSPMARTSETLAMRLVDGAWSAPEPVTFGMTEGIGEPFYSPDGRRLYFLSFRPTPGDPIRRERIWLTERVQGGWSEPRPLDETVTRHPTHWQFSVAADGTLYFTSEIQGVRGEQDIYSAPYEEGRYLPPRDLGPEINSEGKELTPYISPDQSYLLFARVGDKTRKADLFVSFRQGERGWTPAVPLGDHVNTDDNDLCPIVSPDGRYLFYTHRTDDGYGIFWLDASFILRLRPVDAR